MAMHRRPVRLATPAELLLFDPAEWADPDDEAEWQAFERWTAARRAYTKRHPDSELGLCLIRCVLSGGFRVSV